MKVVAVTALALRLYRRPLVIWVLALGSLGALQVLFWPSIRQASGLEDLVRSLPEALRAMIGTDDLLSPEGFLASRLNSVFPLLITVYAAFRSSTEPAGAEQERAFEILLSTPVARWEILLGRFLAVSASVLALMLATGAGDGGRSEGGGHAYRSREDHVYGRRPGPAWDRLRRYHAGCRGGHRGSRCLAGFRGGDCGGYLRPLYSFAPLVPELEPLRPLTPFDHAIGYEPLVNGLEPFGSAVLLAIALVGLVAGLAAFERRDLRG